LLSAVVDTGILVSAAINDKGQPHRLLLRWRDSEFNLVTCSHLLAELTEVLERPRLRSLIKAADARDLVEALRLAADLRADPDPAPGRVPADPDDDFVVGLARETGADYVVASDKHLLGLRSARPPVVTPKAMLAILDRAGR
jgi:putative PIN family toxin of toxin-antitoxin system